MNTGAARVRSILDAIKTNPRAYDSNIAEEVATSEDHAADVARAIIDEIPNDESRLIGVALCFMAVEALPGLVDSAVAHLTRVVELPRGRGVQRRIKLNEAAADVIRKASSQRPQAVHRHLETLFRVDPTYFWRAFREAPPEAASFLLPLCRSPNADERRCASFALLQTRSPEAFRAAKGVDARFLAHLDEVGFTETADGFRQLYSSRALHVLFPRSYVEKMHPYYTRIGGKVLHPTWQREPAGITPHRVGGLSVSCCAVCGSRLRRLILLEPPPRELGICDLAQLEIVACFSCLGWKADVLSYQHGGGVAPRSMVPTSPHSLPLDLRTNEAIEETAVTIVDVGDRWQWQECGAGNIHRIGGHPSWVQGGEYPTCPDCAAKSRFILQLDSGLPTTKPGNDWDWGDAGVCYVFWCDRCQISSLSWQCS